MEETNAIKAQLDFIKTKYQYIIIGLILVWGIIIFYKRSKR